MSEYELAFSSALCALPSALRNPRYARCSFAPVWGCRIESSNEARVVDQVASDSPVTQEELVRFFGVLSHDLKSPIFAVDGFSDLLLTDYLDKLDEEGQDFLRRIRSSAQYMKRVLDEMSHMVKLLARPSAHKPTPLREIGRASCRERVSSVV